jgi:hypothetical protein
MLTDGQTDPHLRRTTGHGALVRNPIAETNRMRLVLFDFNNTISGPYMAATHRIRISVMPRQNLEIDLVASPWPPGG